MNPAWTSSCGLNPLAATDGSPLQATEPSLVSLEGMCSSADDNNGCTDANYGSALQGLFPLTNPSAVGASDFGGQFPPLTSISPAFLLTDLSGSSNSDGTSSHSASSPVDGVGASLQGVNPAAVQNVDPASSSFTSRAISTMSPLQTGANALSDPSSLFSSPQTQITPSTSPPLDSFLFNAPSQGLNAYQDLTSCSSPASQPAPQPQQPQQQKQSSKVGPDHSRSSTLGSCPSYHPYRAPAPSQPLFPRPFCNQIFDPTLDGLPNGFACPTTVEGPSPPNPSSSVQDTAKNTTTADVSALAVQPPFEQPIQAPAGRPQLSGLPLLPSPANSQQTSPSAKSEVTLAGAPGTGSVPLATKQALMLSTPSPPSVLLTAQSQVHHYVPGTSTFKNGQALVSNCLPLLREGVHYDLRRSQTEEMGSFINVVVTDAFLREGGTGDPSGDISCSSPLEEHPSKTYLAPVPSRKVYWADQLLDTLTQQSAPLSGVRLAFVVPDVPDWEALKDELIAAGPLKTDRIWEKMVVAKGRWDGHVEYSSCLTCCRSRDSAPLVRKQDSPTKSANKKQEGPPSADDASSVHGFVSGRESGTGSGSGSSSGSGSEGSASGSSHSVAQAASSNGGVGGGAGDKSSSRSRRSTHTAVAKRCTCRTRITAKVRTDRRGVLVTITDHRALCTAPTDRKERSMVSKFIHQLAADRLDFSQLQAIVQRLLDLDQLSETDKFYYREWLVPSRYAQVLRAARVRDYKGEVGANRVDPPGVHNTTAPS